MQFYKITTDDTLREIVQHGSMDFHYYVDDIFKYNCHYIDWHWHHEIEIITAFKGTIICLIGSEEVKLQQGCSMLINSGIMHRFETTDGAIMPNIVFSPNILSEENTLIYKKYILPFIQSNITYKIFKPETEWQNQILQVISSIYNHQEQRNPSELYTLQLLLKLWGILINNIDVYSDLSLKQKRNIQQHKLQIMIQFIKDNYTKKLSLLDIASSASISKSSALQIFKSKIHVSPVEYLIQYRLTQSARQLRMTEESVYTIAKESGFSDSSYFCRKFKEFYHMTPNEYRRHKNIDVK